MDESSSTEFAATLAPALLVGALGVVIFVLFRRSGQDAAPPIDEEVVRAARLAGLSSSATGEECAPAQTAAPPSQPAARSSAAQVEMRFEQPTVGSDQLLDGTASAGDWVAYLSTLYEASPTLDPVEYHGKVVEKFPDISSSQVKNRVKKIRDAAKTACQKAQDSEQSSATIDSGTSLVGPDFLVFGDPLSDHGRAPVPLDKDSCVRSANDWEVLRTEKTGFGVYAKTPIQAGDFIIRETPLLQAHIELGEDTSKVEDVLENRTSLEEAFLKIHLEAQTKIMQLGDFSTALLQNAGHESKAAEELRNILKEEPCIGVAANALKELVARGMCCSEDINGKTVPGVFMTNAIPTGDDGRYSLCPQIARFNHSCAPNALFHFYIETGDHYVRATRRIEIGDEICVDYFGCSGDPCQGVALLDRDTRREWMQFNFGSFCACAVCDNSPCDISASDCNRAEIKTLINDLHHTRNFEIMHRQAARILGLLKIEGLIHPRIIQVLAHVIQSVNAPRGTEQDLLMWTRLKYEAHRFMFGDFDAHTQEIKKEGKRLERSAKKRGNKSK